MVYYFLPLIFSVIGAIFLKENIYKHIFLLFICVYLVFIVGLKGDVDPDYVSYEFLFNSSPVLSDGFPAIKRYSDEYGFEFGLTVINVILHSMSLDLYWFFSIIALISVYCIYKISIKNINSNCFLTFSLLYSISLVGLWIQVRFGLACLAALLSILFYFEKNKLASLFFITISFMFHTIVFSIFIPIAIYFLFGKIGFNKKYMITILLIMSTFIFIDFSTVLNAVLLIFNDRYGAYSLGESGNILSFYVRFAFFVVMLIITKNKVHESTNADKFLLSMIFSSVIIFILATQVTILYRLGVFFELGYIYFLRRTSYGSIYNYYFGLLMIIILLLYRMTGFESEVLPYYNILIN